MMKKSIQFNVLLSGECKEAVNIKKVPKKRQRIAKSTPTKQCDATTNEQVVSSQAVFSCMTEQTKGVFSYNPEIKVGTEKAQTDLKDKILRILRSVTADKNPPIIESPISGDNDSNPAPVVTIDSKEDNSCRLQDALVKRNCDNSNGELKNITLAKGIQISGNNGTLSGTVTGDPEGAGLLNGGTIMANAEVSNLIINGKVTIDKTALLKQGVKFKQNDYIPMEINLSHILPSFTLANINKNQPALKILNLSSDVLVDSKQSLLEQINTLDLLVKNNWKLTQNSETGYLELIINKQIFSFAVVSVSQVNTEKGIIINDDESIQVVTELGRKIILQPIINNLSQFLDIEFFQNLGLTILDNGVMQTSANEETKKYYVARVSMMSEPVVNKMPLGFNSVKRSTLPQYLKFISLIGGNLKYSQAIYPATNHEAELLAYDNKARFYNNGRVEITIDEKLYRGVFAYDITQRTNTSDKISFEILENSFIIHYTNGDSQHVNLLK